MEILLIRHGESLHNTRKTTHLDSMLTSKGMAQATSTAAWIKNNIDCQGWKGITSPYYRTLQTSSAINVITGIPIFVNDLAREYLPPSVYARKEVNGAHDTYDDKKGLFVSNRNLLFQNIFWDKYWNEVDKKFFVKENEEDFVKRMEYFLEVLPDAKWMIVTHGAVCVYLTELLSKTPKEEILNNRLNTPNCSMTWYKDGVIKHKYKIVY